MNSLLTAVFANFTLWLLRTGAGEQDPPTHTSGKLGEANRPLLPLKTFKIRAIVSKQTYTATRVFPSLTNEILYTTGC